MTTAKKSRKEKISQLTEQKLKGENELHAIPLRFTDTTLRDAHQSLWATRMRTSDIIDILETIDAVGYYSLEMWGGATFDVCLRFLREDPWERLKTIRAIVKRTPLQMLLRGQNLVGYRNYPDDVVERFIALACKNGVDIFRIFDPLNDTRNMETAIRAVKKHGAHAQGTIAYTISPVHTIDKYVEYGREQVAVGIDSLCIKDMAGILSPIMAEKLVSALIKEIDVPIQLHCHATSGMAIATYVEGVRAGAGAIDCSVASMAGFSGQPPVETMVAIFKETDYAGNIDMEAVAKISAYFEKLAPQRKLKSASDSFIDPEILIHQIPGGMISNFRSQLDMQNALDKLPEALAEVARVREDLGYPPLVTPTSQMVGAQAVMNVISGQRYKIVSNEVKEYIKGMYGKSPGKVNPEIVKLILPDEKPITHRPADKLQPMLPHAIDDIEPDLITNEEDILSYCILPEPALEFFKWRRLPPQQRLPIPADVELNKKPELHSSSKTSMSTGSDPAKTEKTPSPLLHYEDYRGIGHLIQQAVGLKVEEFCIKRGDLQVHLRGDVSAMSVLQNTDNLADYSYHSTSDNQLSQIGESASQKSGEKQVAEKVTLEPEASDQKTVNAPLTGTFYASNGAGKSPFVKIGDIVKKGEKVCSVEAMKLFNEVSAPEDGTITEFLVQDGTQVQKDQPLIKYRPT